MKGYRKSDVEFHSDGYRDAHAAVNVKDHGSYRELDSAIAQALDHLGMQVDDVDALHETISEDVELWDIAAADGWEQASDLAAETFGPGSRCYSEGRSGGWLVVADRAGRVLFDVDDVAGWDAVALHRWALFAHRVRLIADDQAYRMAFGYLANVAQPAPALAGTGVGL